MPSRRVTPLPVTELTVADGHWDTVRAPIDLVVIHTMVGTWQSADARFNAGDNQSSAHYGVCLDGHIVHWVDEIFNAYHAGNYPVNERSIGIEHEDGGDYNGVRPDVLYTTSANLVRDICAFYGIPIDRDHIRKHSEVCLPPGTQCPDALDIDRIVQQAAVTPPAPAVHWRLRVAMHFRPQPDVRSTPWGAELPVGTQVVEVPPPVGTHQGEGGMVYVRTSGDLRGWLLAAQMDNYTP